MDVDRTKPKRAYTYPSHRVAEAHDSKYNEKPKYTYDIDKHVYEHFAVYISTHFPHSVDEKFPVNKYMYKCIYAVL
jgi:hypothetical protein